MTTKIRRSSGNVFNDLGFPAEEAVNLKMRSDLMIRLSILIDARGLTQAQAAALFGVTQPRVSDLVRGKIDRFSIDTLVAMLGHAASTCASWSAVRGLPDHSATGQLTSHLARSSSGAFTTGNTVCADERSA